MQRYKSLTGFSIYALGVRYVLCTRYVLRGVKGFISYRIYRQVNISIFASGKNIALRSNISQKKTTTRRREAKTLFRVVLSYFVASREFVCQIPHFLLNTVLRKPTLFGCGFLLYAVFVEVKYRFKCNIYYLFDTFWYENICSIKTGVIISCGSGVHSNDRGCGDTCL